MMIGQWRAVSKRLAALTLSAWPRRGLIAEACLNLLAAQIRLRLLPLKHQGVGNMTNAMAPSPAEAFAGANETERQAARDIGWAVTRVAAYSPFPALCLAQALAARAMLRRRGIGSIMRFGVARPDAAGFEAHAWLEAAGVEVTGYPVAPHLREIGCVISDGAGRR